MGPLCSLIINSLCSLFCNQLFEQGKSRSTDTHSQARTHLPSTMSSAPQSMPETPSKLPAAVKSRTPLPEGPTNGAHKTTTAPPKRDVPETSVGETQLPSYTPTPEPETIPASRPAEIDSQSRQEPEQSNDTDEEEEDDGESILRGFEWPDFEHRYTDTLKSKFEEECDIIEEFDAWAAVTIPSLFRLVSRLY